MVLVVLGLLVGAAGPVAAQSDEPAWSDSLYDQFAGMVGEYNENVEPSDLGVASNLLAGKSVNIYVEGDGGTAVYSFTMDDGNRITDLSRERNPDAQLKMTTDRATVQRVSSSSNPAAAFQTAVESGDIVIGGEDGHLVEQVTWGVVNALRGVLM